MALAHDQAIEAWRADEVPVGAILVSPDGSTVLAAAHNRVESRRDATAHAEMLAITRACARVRNQRLNGCVLYVTKEPCPMCAGAGILARLARVVFAVRDPKAGCLGGAAAIHTLPGLNHRLEVAHGVLEAECLALLRSYFQLKRSAPGASRAPHPPRGARPD
jgi:tRNA(adenine34) deaminase